MNAGDLVKSFKDRCVEKLSMLVHTLHHRYQRQSYTHAHTHTVTTIRRTHVHMYATYNSSARRGFSFVTSGALWCFFFVPYGVLCVTYGVLFYFVTKDFLFCLLMVFS